MRTIIIAVLLLCVGCNSEDIISDEKWRLIRERNAEREKARRDSIEDAQKDMIFRMSIYYYHTSVTYWQLWMDNRFAGNNKKADRYRDTFFLYKDSLQHVDSIMRMQ